MDPQQHRPALAGAPRRGRMTMLLCLSALCLIALAGPSSASFAPSADSTAAAQPTTPSAEAWYRVESPTCSTPIGCLPVALPAVYPAGTLHVGVVAGQEESRTYIALQMPALGTVEGGTLKLPVGPVTDGTVQPDSAKVVACLVRGTVTDKVEGDAGSRPDADCSVSAPALAATTPSGVVLTVDLAPFASEWSGSGTGALALLPADGAAPTDTWHLAFSRHDRTGSGVAPLTATLLVASTDEATAPTDQPVPGTQVPPVAPVTSLPPITSDVLPPQPAPAALAPAPSLPGPRTFVPVARSFDDSFAYPGVFLLPLLGLLAAGWAGRAFTRDLAEEQQ